MSHYSAPRINTALGLEPHADIDMALTVIAQLRASVEDCAELREAVHRLQTQTKDLKQEVCDHRSARAEAESGRKALRDERDAARAELKAANENANAGAERDAAEIRALRTELETARAAHRYAERVLRERDSAYAVLHHLTGEYAP